MTLLTIVVPTYNRAQHLGLLLRCLHEQISVYERSVQVLVSDNASTDGTADLLHDWQTRWPRLKTRRNVSNLGAEGNFCACLDHIDTQYFWILGDDDLPKESVVGKLVGLLNAEVPDLVYLRSEWVPQIKGPAQGEPVAALNAITLGQLEFAREVHVWFTFISGVVVNRERLVSALGDHTVRRHIGTSLVQLGWVYPVLAHGTKFLFVTNLCVLATKDNTGGYPLLTVFGVNFPRVTREALADRPGLADLIVSRAVRHYLPGLVWASRRAPAGRFAVEGPWPGMKRELGGRRLYRWLLVPIGHAPRWLARVVYDVWRVINRFGRFVERPLQ
jgi:glycosyltransferase involved in cell wall biosynthesis